MQDMIDYPWATTVGKHKFGPEEYWDRQAWNPILKQKGAGKGHHHDDKAPAQEPQKCRKARGGGGKGGPTWHEQSGGTCDNFDNNMEVEQAGWHEKTSDILQPTMAEAVMSEPQKVINTKHTTGQ